jgi:hypothetical protein
MNLDPSASEAAGLSPDEVADWIERIEALPLAEQADALDRVREHLQRELGVDDPEGS